MGLCHKPNTWLLVAVVSVEKSRLAKKNEEKAFQEEAVLPPEYLAATAPPSSEKRSTADQFRRNVKNAVHVNNPFTVVVNLSHGI